MSAPTHPTQPQPTQHPPAWQPPPPEWGQATNPTPPPRRTTGRTLALLAVVAIVGLGISAAIDGSDTASDSSAVTVDAAPAPDPEPAEVEGPTTVAFGADGTTVDLFDNPTATIHVYRVREIHDPYDLIDGHWMVATVDVTALRDGIWTPDFYVLDAKGRKYTDTFMTPDGTRHLIQTELQQGQSLAGVVAFDLPVRHGKLVVPHSDGEPQLVWKF